jgi:1-deoxy-D-xylulose-5-phosphate reductoisomerase
LHDKIGFNDIYRIIERTLTRVPVIQHPTYNDFVATNEEARRIAASLID